MRGRWSKAVIALAVAGAATLVLAACGAQDDGRPLVVATTPLLGAVAADVVGDAAEVRVVLPEGGDPHDYQPSARDAATIGDATVVVANGEGLEEGLDSVLDGARSDGVPVFTATEQVELLAAFGGDDPDPHVFTDPRRMAEVVLALDDALRAEGVDVADGAERTAARLRALDRRIEDRLAELPAAGRRIVTGHESVTYYADRYGLEVVATAIPNRSTGGRVSASDIAEVAEVVEREDVPTIFTEPGTGEEAAAVIAEETGAQVVIVHTESFGPGVTSYDQYLEDLTEALVAGLGDR